MMHGTSKAGPSVVRCAHTRNAVGGEFLILEMSVPGPQARFLVFLGYCCDANFMQFLHLLIIALLFSFVEI